MKLSQVSPGQRYLEKDIQTSVDQILQSNQLCSMASVTLGGKSHINAAYFCFSEDGVIYILTPPSTKHGQNLAHNPAIALAIFDSHQTWDQPKQGLQAFGTAKVAEGAEVSTAIELYTKRFPSLSQWLKRPEEIAQIDARFYRVTLDQIRLNDEVAFGPEVWIDLKIDR